MYIYQAEKLLGLSKPYTHKELKKNYRVFAKENHPDVQGNDKSFTKGVKAYELLKDYLDNPHKYEVETSRVPVYTNKGYLYAKSLLENNTLVDSDIKFYSILGYRQ